MSFHRLGRQDFMQRHRNSCFLLILALMSRLFGGYAAESANHLTTYPDQEFIASGPLEICLSGIISSSR